MPTYYNKLTVKDGNNIIREIDLSQDTITSADDIPAGKYGHLNTGERVLGTGQGGGLTFETGIYEPSADTSGEKILFANTHSEAPAFIMMVDATGTADTTSDTNMQFVWYDYYKLYGVGMPWSASAYRYASAYYAYRATNTGTLSVGGVHCSANSDSQGSGGINYPRFWTDELGFTPNSASTSRYWRAGRTYKWYAIWRQT